MAEQSKFAGALGKLNKRPAAEPTEEVKQEPPSTKATSAVPMSGRGGKRSNPEFSPTTFFVRKETKRKAARLLEDTNAGKDLSDLVEELLTGWISKRSNI